MRFKSLAKGLGSLSKVLRARFFKEIFPVSVTFLITYRCNLKCKYCNVWSLKEDEMTTEEAIFMINELVELGMCRLGFNGGEPLLREDIGQLISCAKDRGVVTTLFSSGYQVPERLRELKNLDILIISLDGSEKVHDAQRGKGAYQIAMKAITAARKEGICVWTNTVITKHNVLNIDFIVQKAEEFGCWTTFQPVLYYPHSSNKDEVERLSFRKDEYREAIKKLMNQKRRGEPIAHSRTYLKHIMNPVWSGNSRKCWAGKLYCAITPNGNVAPCYPIFQNRIWPNGRKLGFGNALKQLPSFNCNGCYCVLAEMDFALSFKPEAVWNAILLS